jgi:hypothetical protein
LGSYIKQIKGYPTAPAGIGDHIRKRRLDLNLFQIEAARIIGCNR